ncbi:MAG: ATPase, T2SS/T4P/T4SS family [Elusimicrobiales bacterium]|nr:ATPase, T2SS/T4P/T4SS family [Elusimicrobiales bacterium]
MSEKSRILCVDDDPDVTALLGRFLSAAGHDVLIVNDPAKAVEAARAQAPSLVLLDAVMPGMDGYKICSLIKKEPALAEVPVIFLTALRQPQDRAKALALGAVDFLSKPVKKEVLLAAVSRHTSHPKVTRAGGQGALPREYPDFKSFIVNIGVSLSLDADRRAALAKLNVGNLYSAAEIAGISERRLAGILADFCRLRYVPIINPDEIQLGVLPLKFAARSGMVPLKDPDGGLMMAVSNPFDLDSLDAAAGLIAPQFSLAVAEPEAISTVYHLAEGKPASSSVLLEAAPAAEKTDAGDADDSPIRYIAGKLIQGAVAERASDIHIEPKDLYYLVRIRVDGDLREFTRLKKMTGGMLIARMKAMGGMDIAEHRRPQDGAFPAVSGASEFVLRLATTSTNYGESLVIRLVELTQEPVPLTRLGMLPAQAEAFGEIARRTQGMVLIVGPTGSGKTTTIYSFLTGIDCRRRSLISVEDPIEFRIPYANQQQVNDKAGVTFKALLKSSVRQDPDILFIGEVRDSESAQIALDFASTGHLTISTLHTANATSAIFRLERVGITRSQMAETLLAVVSQRLIKKLCPHCRKLVPPTEEELRLLSKFTDQKPTRLAKPVGCDRCGRRGYSGRVGVYEVMRVTPEIAAMIRSGEPVSAIRASLAVSGETLLAGSALLKVLSHEVSLMDAYDKVMGEEEGQPDPEPAAPAVPAHVSPVPRKPAAFADEESPSPVSGGKTILLVDDDPDILALAGKYLENEGYSVVKAADGIEAVMHLSKGRFDLVISDVDMPNLDGLRLVEIASEKDMGARFLVFTASSDPAAERRALESGAADFVRKPVKKEVFLLRVRKALGL